MFAKILKQIIHDEFSLWCRGQSANEPTGKSVYDTMTAHRGKDWVALYCGTEHERTCMLFEKQIVHWLQDRLDGKRSTKQRKGLLKRLLLSWPTDSDPVFFIGQRVYGRWTTDVGTLVATVHRTGEDERGFEGVIAAEGEVRTCGS